MKIDQNLSMRRCIGCNATVSDIVGPTHAYMGASPGCWKIYGDVLAREYGELRNPDFHRLTVDAYAAQHTGVESRRSTQSVALHLIALHMLLERELSPRFVTRRMSSMVELASKFRWLTPPLFTNTPSVLDVAIAQSAQDHEAATWRWAKGVWDAWAEHHETVRGWAESFAD